MSKSLYQHSAFSMQTEDLAQFRQWGSKTPGHPENFETPGVEVTTGKLLSCMQFALLGLRFT